MMFLSFWEDLQRNSRLTIHRASNLLFRLQAAFSDVQIFLWFCVDNQYDIIWLLIHVKSIVWFEWFGKFVYHHFLPHFSKTLWCSSRALDLDLDDYVWGRAEASSFPSELPAAPAAASPGAHFAFIDHGSFDTSDALTNILEQYQP